MSSLDDAVQTVPSKRQLKWQEKEFYAFVHFGINTFTGKEWGDGTDSPDLFAPTEFSADQIVKSIKKGGMTGLVLTCKHHDGFCLWPSRYTDYSVAASPFQNGMGDIVKEISDACRREGLAFGVYLSPWDRHERSYGRGEKYNRFFLNQLEELLTGYGDIFCVWFDGANGEGKNGKKQFYDWDAYYALIRKLQPGAVINVCGPDVRWCGNEAGHVRHSEWSVVPESLRDQEKIAEKSQQEDDDKFRQKIDTIGEDLGSREVLAGAQRLIWYPAEVNTSIRPNWFYNPVDDEKVRSAGELLEIYYGAVGGNASFLLNIPPDKRGIIHEKDVSCLEEIGNKLEKEFGDSMIVPAKAYFCGRDISFLLHKENGKTWKGREEQDEIVVTLLEEARIRHIVLMEDITLSQRVESFEILVSGKKIYEGTTVGYKKICRLDDLRIKEFTLRFKKSRYYPTLKFMGIYRVV